MYTHSRYARRPDSFDSRNLDHRHQAGQPDAVSGGDKLTYQLSSASYVLEVLGFVKPHRPRSGRAAPGKLVISLALALETGVFLWLGATVAVPWRFAIAPSIIVAAVLATAMAGSPRNDRGARPWPIRAAFGLALATFLVFILLLVLAQEALTGEEFLLFPVMPLVLAFALFLEVGLPLFLILALVLISATGVLMDTRPLWFMAVPLVISIGVGSVLFRAIALDPGPSVRRLAGARWRGRGSGPA